MAKKTIKAQMKQRRDTKANWEATNPVLLDGELGIVSDDPNLYKVGDGATAWNSLPFRGFDGTLAQELGTSENAVISQKVVSEKLTELESEVQNTESRINTEIKDFKDAVTDQVEGYKPIVINGNVTNAADEEDITSENNLLKLKDRSALNGMGYVILRKNKTFVEQVTKSNTIYEIRYDFDLNGEEITIPKDCVLDFKGGCLSNGKIIGDGKTSFNQDVTYKIFNKIILKNFALEFIDVRWLGAKPAPSEIEATTDSSYYFQMAMDMCQYYQGIPIKVIGTYLISNTVVCRDHFQMFGNSYVERPFFSSVDDTPKSMIVVNGGIAAFNIVGRSEEGSTMTYCSFSIHNLKFKSAEKYNNVLFRISTSGAPSRPCSINKCEFSNFDKVLKIAYDENCPPGTMVCNMSIYDCNSFVCNSFIHTVPTDKMTLMNLHIYDNVIEENKEDAILLCNPAGYIHIENNLFESNRGYTIHVTNRTKQCNIESNGNYFEDNTQYICIEDSTETLLSPSLNLVTLNSYSNYFYGPTRCKILLSSVYIYNLDDCKYLKSDSKFYRCWFSKNIVTSNFPISFLTGYNWFDEIPTCIGAPFSSFPLVPSKYSTKNGKLVCAKSVFETAWATTIYKPVAAGTSAGDKAIFITKAYNGYDGQLTFNTIYGKQDIKQCGQILPREGYCVAVVEYPANPTTQSYAAELYIPTSDQSAYYEACVTVIELKLYPNVNYIGDLCYGYNYVNPTTEVDSKQNIIAVSTIDESIISWKDTRWVGQNGVTAGISKSGTFDNKPSPSDIYIGFKYFCTDRQTSEGANDGIEIIYKGGNDWVDALGRVVE